MSKLKTLNKTNIDETFSKRIESKPAKGFNHIKALWQKRYTYQQLNKFLVINIYLYW
jgi:hypothetical protein